MIKEYKNLHFVKLDDQFAIFQEKEQLPNKFIDIGGIPEEYWNLVEAAPMMYNHITHMASAYNSLLPMLEGVKSGLLINPEHATLADHFTKLIVTMELMKGNLLACMRCAEVGKYRAMIEANESEEN